MSQLFEPLHERGITGEGLASGLFIILLIITWPIYMWMQGKWLLFAPLEVSWLASITYFSLEIWALMFVAKEFTQYPFMSLDASLGGALFAVGAALRADERSHSLRHPVVVSWIAIICTTILLVRTYALASRVSHRPK